MFAKPSRNRALWRCLLLAAPLCAVWGCGPKKPNTYEVSGTVTWEGKPLDQGDIIFEAIDGSTAACADKIADGQYRCQVFAGAKRVQIQATRQTSYNQAMHQYEREAFIPMRYNAQTKLRAEVVPEGENHYDFDLRSAKGK